ncbi:hypothetical protein NX801_25125 [Streptomyces sp. LP05-1]|uniref:Integral membrane protein n=1 Tax=Streptomyces pyxinae TaxID=2970734 RepID=A0ABT2CNP6_9ACTN|nr:hypothetical protein [Streptomyces sp. LP05-1]MCS0638871.1 hypothetical protein [Streptomyces sp. LP05-1]
MVSVREGEPVAGNGETSESAVLLAEYAQIKDEQRARIGFRDNLLYVTLAAVTALTAVALQTKRPQLLLALPVVCIVLGWTYLVNDEKISAIGRYVRTELAGQLATRVDAGAPLFGWETFHRSDAKRVSRKVTQTIVDLTAFFLTPFSALVAFWCSGRDNALLTTASVLEAVMLVGLGIQFLRYAER